MDSYFDRIAPTLKHLLSISDQEESYNIQSFINYLHQAKNYKYVALIMEDTPLTTDDSILFIPTSIGNQHVFNKKTLLIAPLLEVLGSYPTFLIKGTEYYIKIVRSNEKLVVPNRETMYAKIAENEAGG